MDPLGATASVIAVLQISAKVLAYLNDVKEASSERAKCAIDAAHTHALLLTLRFRLEEGGFSQPWYEAVQALAVKNGPLDQFKQVLESLQANMTDKGRLRKAGDALVWKFKKDEINGILARIERFKSLVEIALQMDHFKLSLAIKDDTGFVRKQVPVIQSGVDRIRQNQEAARHRRLLDWLSPTSYPAQQSDTIKRRQEGTGQWFLEAPQFNQWLKGANATLFCPGIPGAGKTMMAAITIDHLLKLAQKSSHGVAYVYCNYKAQEEQDVSSMLAAILKQLAQSRVSAMEHIERLHEQHADGEIKPNLEEISTALQAAVAHYPRSYIVVDALDECRDHDGTRQQFLARLRNLQAQGDIRVMVTSRFIPDIVGAFGQALRLEVQASEVDTKCYVAGQVHRLPTCIQSDPALQEIVQTKIVEAANGMFLLARLHVDSLLDKRTPKQVKSALDKLAKSASALDNAYEGALQRIDCQLRGDCELAKRVVSWITLAKRPLNTNEICCALAVEPGETTIDPENMLGVEDLVSVCAGLVVVDPESAIIRFVHYTTQEYFERIQQTWNPDSLARTPLIVAAERGHTPIVKLLLDWGADIDAGGGLYDNALGAASAKHHRSVIDLLLQKGASVNRAVEGRSGNAFYKDAAGVHELLDRSVNIDQPMEFPGFALYAASARGDEALVKILLDHGADVDARGGRYGHALHGASAKGHNEIVKLLLDHGADINAQDQHRGTALYLAAAGGHDAVVKLLIERGADVNCRCRQYGFAAFAASARGHELALRHFISNGMVLGTENDAGDTVVSLAAFYGRISCLQLLLDSYEGSHVLRDRYGRTLLWWAAAVGKIATIDMLISQYHCDPRIPDNFGRTPFWIAARKGHHAVARMLRGDRDGADVPPMGSINRDYGQRAECDVCTMPIPGTTFHYHCRLCAYGDWDMCEDCKEKGASCAEATHVLVKRAIRGGMWVELGGDDVHS
ncbi:ankyrin repeat domain containing protein [Paramyrothecium foliicola]|nr:ankyrin repeat domain containing protein [Paramyrothecium foliicola]